MNTIITEVVNKVAVIGEITQPFGKNGAFFREIGLIDATEVTIKCFENWGASCSTQGSVTTVVFRGNTSSAYGFMPRNIEQILHLSGHSFHADVWWQLDGDMDAINALWGSYEIQDYQR